jgi:hypothetical protein
MFVPPTPWAPYEPILGPYWSNAWAHFGSFFGTIWAPLGSVLAHFGPIVRYLSVYFFPYFYTHIYVYIYIYVYTYVHTYIYTCIYIHVYLYTHVYIYKYIYAYTHFCKCHLLIYSHSGWFKRISDQWLFHRHIGPHTGSHLRRRTNHPVAFLSEPILGRSAFGPSGLEMHFQYAGHMRGNMRGNMRGSMRGSMRGNRSSLKEQKSKQSSYRCR